MSDEPLRALIVDDDSISRRTIGFALEQENFCCDYAIGGDDALTQMSERRFDLVVTDLCMPKQHGHSLAARILAMARRPLVIVHSAIDDPRMTRDLISRGVDDVIYKPTNYSGFAAKAFVWATRHRHKIVLADELCEDVIATDVFSNQGEASTTVDLFFAATSDTQAFKEIGEKIKGDQQLSEAVLEAANRVEYNRTDKCITDIAFAIKQLGLRKIADLALDQLRSVSIVCESDRLIHQTPFGGGGCRQHCS